ncbi:hypothetical protein [Paenibacillus ginsengarvi]|uniref:Uncharacterized protein n=1 Tax=Paenibacillus ginsengarvi TaxID=400777 RepID=A0A3B0CIR5_9BACL|nr:hypothetical protein [Paenibacillus ginsengarvi]RKN84598.1 hypothetical protein D7M11_11420 [Paenibacillus ginsengarvi]
MNINRLFASLYGIVLLLTVVLFLAAGEWGADAGVRFVSLLALLFAETMGWRLIVYANAAGAAGKSLPARLLFVTVTTLYGAAVVLHIVLFWLVWSVSLFAYILIHLATLVVWGTGMGLSLAYSKYVGDQAKRTTAQTQLIDRMRAKLRSIQQTLDRLDWADHEGLRGELRELLEKLTYSASVPRGTMPIAEDSMLWQIDALEQCVRKLEQNKEDKGNIELSRQLIVDITEDLARRNRQAGEFKIEKRV